MLAQINYQRLLLERNRLLKKQGKGRYYLRKKRPERWRTKIFGASLITKTFPTCFPRAMYVMLCVSAAHTIINNDVARIRIAAAC